MRDSDDGETAMPTTYKLVRMERTALDRELGTVWLMLALTSEYRVYTDSTDLRSEYSSVLDSDSGYCLYKERVGS